MINIRNIAHEHYPLKKVLMHRPEAEIAQVTEATVGYFNFTSVPDADGFLREFDDLAAAFRTMGTEVVLLGDVLAGDAEALGYIARRANMTYTRDLAVITPAGALLAGMAIDGRKGDPAIIGRACAKLGIPIHTALEPDGMLEGGGVTFFRGDTVIVGECERTNATGLARLEACARAAGLTRMVTMPVPPGMFHIDGQLVFIDRDLAIVDPVALDVGAATIKDLESGETHQQRMLDFLDAEDVDVIAVTEEDGWAAANFVMTAPRHIIGYEWAGRVMDEVVKRGGKAIGVRGNELRKGNGGPHCMTCPLER